MMIVHRFVIWLNRFKARPNVRRSAWICKNATVPKSCIINERVKIRDSVVLGEHCFVNDDVVIGGATTIGRCCRIEKKVMITSCNSDGNGKVHSLPLFSSNKHVSGEEDIAIKIGKHVAIENGSIITKGVTIGDGALVMCGAVVFDDVPANAIVRGNPAEIIGYRKEAEK